MGSKSVMNGALDESEVSAADSAIEAGMELEAAGAAGESEFLELPTLEDSSDKTQDSEETQDGEQSATEDSPIDDTFSLTARIGALLFVATRPLSVQMLQELARSATGKHAAAEDVEAALEELRTMHDATRTGISLVEVAGAYQLRTAPELARTVQRLIPPRARRLSKAAAETLAIIAYKQPVQRAEIESVRGVDAAPTLKTLLEAKLVRVVGREDTVGQPALYGTTSTFLEKFGLRDLTELPPVREIARIANDPGEADGGTDSSASANGAGSGPEPLSLFGDSAANDEDRVRADEEAH